MEGGGGVNFDQKLQSEHNILELCNILEKFGFATSRVVIDIKY